MKTKLTILFSLLISFYSYSQDPALKIYDVDFVAQETSIIVTYSLYDASINSSCEARVTVFDESNTKIVTVMVGLFEQGTVQFARRYYKKKINLLESELANIKGMIKIRVETSDETSCAYYHASAESVFKPINNLKSESEVAKSYSPQNEENYIKSFSGHSSSVYSVVFSLDGKYIASASADNTMKLWDVSSGQCVRTFSEHSYSVFSVAFSPNGKYIASASNDKTIKLWNVSSGTCVGTFSGHSDGVNSVAFSPDGKYIASGSYDKTIKLWNVSSGTCVSTFSGHSAGVNSVAFSPDGTYIASGSGDYTIKLWNISSGTCVSTFSGYSSCINSVAFSADGKYIASASNDNTIKLLEVSSGTCINIFSGHSEYVYSVAFSSDGKYIASASNDKTIKLWNVSSGTCDGTFSGHSSGVNSVAFSPDGKYIASGSNDFSTKLWDVNKFNILGAIAPPKPTAPANLMVSTITFSDSLGNNNQLLDANENAEIEFTLSNKGKGDAYNLVVEIHDLEMIEGVQYSSTQSCENLAAGAERIIKIPISGTMKLESGKTHFKIEIKEGNGFNADPFEISFNTQEFKHPTIALADYKFTTDEEGKIKLGSTVSLNIVVQNKGQGDASDVTINFVNPTDVFPANETSFNINKLKPNESRNINYEFFANKRYSGTEIPIQVVISESYQKYGESKTLTVSLEQTLSKTQQIAINAQYEKPITIDNISLTSDVDKNIPVNGINDENKFALIIGNEDYSSFQQNITSEMNVEFASNDAMVFKEYCIKTFGVPENNITLLLNATAGKMYQAIDKINKLIQATNGKADVIVYYAGHGLPDEKTKEPYLIPVDVSGSNISSAIKLSFLYEKLTEFSSQKVTVFLDACFSGGGREAGLLAARSIKITPKSDYLNGNIVVFTASSGEESSLPWKDKQHGMFTYFLLKEFQDTKGDVSFSDLGTFLKDKVGLESVRANSKQQSPQVLFSPENVDSWEKWKLK